MKKYLAEIVSIVLFLVLIPLYSYVNFYQNDDWNRNTTIIRFLSGDFTLLNVTATTFYSQGFLGFIWAYFLGPDKIPYLTLLVSVLNFYIFYQILKFFSKLSIFSNLIISLILFFNVFHIYSSIGFMTENYLLFFFLFSIYFYLKFEKTAKIFDLIISNIFAFISFYAKQNALIFPVGLALYFLIQKRYKEFKITVISIFLTLGSYYFLFPRTGEMKDKDFNFSNILNFDYSYSLIYSILIYLSFFSLPLIFGWLIKEFSKFDKKKFITISITTIALFISLNYFFKPGLISWEEFPYLENTFERTGFLPRTVEGTKYQFKYNYDLYFYIDLFSKVFLSIFLSLFIYNLKKSLSPFILSLIAGLGLMLFVSVFFDRYILLLVPLFYLTIIKFIDFDSIILKISLSFYLIFVAFFSYLLAADFIYTHNYIWSKSQELIQSSNARPNEINSSGAWNRLHKNNSSKYLFSYDDLKKNKELGITYNLIENKEISFIGNLFINPKIYLYKLKD